VEGQKLRSGGGSFSSPGQPDGRARPGGRHAHRPPTRRPAGRCGGPNDLPRARTGDELEAALPSRTATPPGQGPYGTPRSARLIQQHCRAHPAACSTATTALAAGPACAQPSPDGPQPMVSLIPATPWLTAGRPGCSSTGIPRWAAPPEREPVGSLDPRRTGSILDAYGPPEPVITPQSPDAGTCTVSAGDIGRPSPSTWSRFRRPHTPGAPRMTSRFGLLSSLVRRASNENPGTSGRPRAGQSGSATGPPSCGLGGPAQHGAQQCLRRVGGGSAP